MVGFFRPVGLQQFSDRNLLHSTTPVIGFVLFMKLMNQAMIYAKCNLYYTIYIMYLCNLTVDTSLKDGFVELKYETSQLRSRGAVSNKML